MTSLINNRTLYPQWHKKHISPNKEFGKKFRIFQREKLEIDKLDRENLRKKRFEEYSSIDDKRYYFTWEDFQNYLTVKDFNIKKCFIPNIIKKEKQEEKDRLEQDERERIKQEMDEIIYLEYLRNYNENDYINYFYEDESFVSDSEEYHNYDNNL